MSPRKRRRPTTDPAAIAITNAAATDSTLSEIGVKPMARAIAERELAMLDSALNEELAAWGRESFWGFVTDILFPDTWQQHYTEALHLELADALQNREYGSRKAFFLPRGSRKSYLLTIAYSAWLIIRDPNIRILLVGARKETVGPFNRLLRSIFEPDTPGFERFRACYPEFILQGRRSLSQTFQFTVPNRTVAYADPTVRATYIGVTGAGWRCDVLILDDAIERRNVTSPEMSVVTGRKIRDLFPLVDKTGRYNWIDLRGTRWAYHDPYGPIIGEYHDDVVALMRDDEKLPPFDTVVRHALEDPNRLCEVCPEHIVKAHPHGHPDLDAGEPIAAPVWTKEMILSEYDTYMTDPALGESEFWHQYMNVCLAPDLQAIKPEWIRSIDRPNWPAPKRRILALDAADKDNQRLGMGDYTCLLFGEFDDEGRLLITHGFRSNRWTRDEAIRTAISHCRATDWWPHIFVKEKATNDPSFTDWERAFTSQSRYPHIVPATRPTNVKKYDWCVSAYQAPFERGEILFGSAFPPDLLTRLRHEVINLGQIKNDDMADALALFFYPGVRLAATAPNPAQTAPWSPPPLCLYDYTPAPTTPFTFAPTTNKVGPFSFTVTPPEDDP